MEITQGEKSKAWSRASVIDKRLVAIALIPGFQPPIFWNPGIQLLSCWGKYIQQFIFSWEQLESRPTEQQQKK